MFTERLQHSLSANNPFRARRLLALRKTYEDSLSDSAGDDYWRLLKPQTGSTV